MQTALIIGLPAILILLLIAMLKLKPLFSYLAIIGLGVFSSFVVELFFCSVLKTQCEPDPLNAVGLIFHSFYVIVICAVIYTILPRKLKQTAR